MSALQRRRVTMDDVLAAIGLLTDQIAILVSAVDDLRCEIEWQGRNGADSDSPIVSATENLDERCDEVEESGLQAALTELPHDSLLTAASRLRAFEQSCAHSVRSPWQSDWATDDDFEIPAGRTVAVDADLWSDVLDIRPAHVIGEGCCCEEGIGAPYLLAWRRGDEFLLRELTDEEAKKLQELCLAWQADEATRHPQQVYKSPAQAQLGLF